jgi:hypothetical protein
MGRCLGRKAGRRKRRRVPNDVMEVWRRDSDAQLFRFLIRWIDALAIEQAYLRAEIRELKEKLKGSGNETEVE